MSSAPTPGKPDLGKARLIDRQTVARGSFLTMTRDRVEFPDGRTLELDLVRHPGAAAVVPILDDGSVLLVRQYRHAADGWLLEVPAGKLDAGEAPETAAARELEEEAGQRAGELVSLGWIWPSPGFTDEVIHLFAARKLAPVSQRLEEDELLTLEQVPFARAVEMATSGEIADSKSVCALLRAARLLT